MPTEKPTPLSAEEHAALCAAIREGFIPNQRESMWLVDEAERLRVECAMWKDQAREAEQLREERDTAQARVRELEYALRTQREPVTIHDEGRAMFAERDLRAQAEQTRRLREALESVREPILKLMGKFPQGSPESRACSAAFAQATEALAPTQAEQDVGELVAALEWYGRGIKSVQTDEHERVGHLGRPNEHCPFCDDGRRARKALAPFGGGKP